MIACRYEEQDNIIGVPHGSSWQLRVDAGFTSILSKMRRSATMQVACEGVRIVVGKMVGNLIG